jgi:hypothetical protein
LRPLLFIPKDIKLNTHIKSSGFFCPPKDVWCGGEVVTIHIWRFSQGFLRTKYESWRKKASFYSFGYLLELQSLDQLFYEKSLNV